MSEDELIEAVATAIWGASVSLPEQPADAPLIWVANNNMRSVGYYAEVGMDTYNRYADMRDRLRLESARLAIAAMRHALPSPPRTTPAEGE